MMKTFSIGYYDAGGIAFILCDKRGMYPISDCSEWSEMGFIRCSCGDKPYKERLVPLADLFAQRGRTAQTVCAVLFALYFSAGRLVTLA